MDIKTMIKKRLASLQKMEAKGEGQVHQTAMLDAFKKAVDWKD